MNTLCRSIFVSATIAVLLTACQKTVPLTPPKTAAAPAPVAQGSTSDPSVPPASDVMTPASPAVVQAGQNKANPQDNMTKPEEAAAMPLPGQGDSHESLALDKARAK
jgi:hypothetical protein